MFALDEESKIRAARWIADQLSDVITVGAEERLTITGISIARGRSKDAGQRTIRRWTAGDLGGMRVDELIEEVEAEIDSPGKWTLWAQRQTGETSAEGHVVTRREQCVLTAIRSAPGTRPGDPSPMSAAVASVVNQSVAEHSAQATASREAERSLVDRLLEAKDDERARDEAVRDTYGDALQRAEIARMEAEHRFELYRVQQGIWTQLGPAVVTAIAPTLPALVGGLVQLLTAGAALLTARAGTPQIPTGITSRLDDLEAEVRDSTDSRRRLESKVDRLIESLSAMATPAGP